MRIMWHLQLLPIQEKEETKMTELTGRHIERQGTPAANSRFAKAGVSCFYYSEVLNSSFVHLMEFSAKSPRLRKAANRYHQC